MLSKWNFKHWSLVSKKYESNSFLNNKILSIKVNIPSPEEFILLSFIIEDFTLFILLLYALKVFFVTHFLIEPIFLLSKSLTTDTLKTFKLE